MRFLHISDLHLGKVIHGVSMLENGDQPYWVDQFLAMTRELRPDAVVIAGDVYDRGSPSGDAVTLLSRMIEELAAMGVCVMLTAGNHDSGQRLSFARDLLARQNVHIAGTVTREMVHIPLRDEYGPVTFWLMPYVFPAVAAQALGDDTIRDYDTAVRRLLAAQEIDTSARNVIVAHQNVTAFGAEAPRGGSESAVGGVGQVDYSAFDAFDYAALGHIHAAYPVGREEVRYAGSPMCYHFNETHQEAKGPVLVEMGLKGAPLSIEAQHITPMHPMRELRGPLEALREAELAHPARGEYLRLVLTDQPLSPAALEFFQGLAEQRDSVLMERVSEFRRFSDDAVTPEAVREKTVEELFADFYTDRSVGGEPDVQDLALLRQAGELLRNTHAEKRGEVDPSLTEALLQYLMRQEGQKA